jgi:translation initiation factor IF-3
MEPYVINYNAYTRFVEIRLIDARNNFHDAIHIKKAKDMAKFSNLQLVCFSEPDKTQLALCKIIDYGKWKYQNGKSEKKKEQNTVATKEIQFTPVISDHDLEHKVKKVIEFLKKGDEVLVEMKFRGIHHRLVADGEKVINKIAEMCKESGKEVHRKKTNDNIIMRLVKI